MEAHRGPQRHWHRLFFKLGDRYMDVFIFINYSLSHTCIECSVSFTINNFWLQH